MGRNAVENNFLFSDTARIKGWLTAEEQALADRLSREANAPSIEYFIRKEQEILNSPRSDAAKRRMQRALQREHEEASRRMMAAVASLPLGSKDRTIIDNIAAKMPNVLLSIPPYDDRAKYINVERRD